MTRPTHALLYLVLAGLVACGGGAEEADEAAPADTTGREQVMFVPDSIIEREVRNRLDADPRFDVEDIDIEVHVQDGNVSLVGKVPTRREMSYAREVAGSAPGVHEVFLDSLEVLSEPKRDAEGEPPTST